MCCYLRGAPSAVIGMLFDAGNKHGNRAQERPGHEPAELQ